jgi:hypothetical protein
MRLLQRQIKLRRFIIKWFDKKKFNPVDLEQYQEKYKMNKIAFYEKKLEELKRQVA